MKSIKMLVATLGLGVVALSSSFAQAHTSVSVGIDLGLPRLLFRAPVYYAPPVAYVPPRVAYERRVVYPQPVVYGSRWNQGYGRGYDRDGRNDHNGRYDRDDRRDWGRDHDGRRDDHRNDRDDHRNGNDHGRSDRR
ncbi:MAG TPA: hypothetical protein VF928_14035 [Usitatibacteraceae bacterium]